MSPFNTSNRYRCFFCCLFSRSRWTADDLAAVPAARLELLAVHGASAAADRPPAAAVARRTVPAAHTLLAVPVAAHIAAAPAARAAHHAGHAAADGAPAARGHVQPHTLRVRGKYRVVRRGFPSPPPPPPPLSPSPGRGNVFRGVPVV